MTFAHLDSIRAEVETLARAFKQAGHRLYLVGGIVRDQWLDKPLDASSDIDLTTDALPVTIKAIVDPIADVLWTQGERFGTIGMRIGSRAFEITTHRAETYRDDSRKPVVSFGDDVSVDLSRRDFTVNAMAIEVPSGDLIDPWGGVDDLAAGRLRTPLSADTSFSDDPLRMLRAARFLTKYKLEPTNELVASAAALHERVRIVAIERIGDEVERLLSLEDPSAGLRFLLDTGVLGEVVCYTSPGCVDDGQLSAGIELCAAVSGGASGGWKHRLAALLVGTFGDEAGVRAATRRLRLSGDDQKEIGSLVRDALTIIDAADPAPPMLRRWRMEVTDAQAALRLARAIAPDEVGRVDIFGERLQALIATEPAGPGPLLDGARIMKLLEIAAGPNVGRAVDFLREQYLEHGPAALADQEVALTQWWAERPAE